MGGKGIAARSRMRGFTAVCTYGLAVAGGASTPDTTGRRGRGSRRCGAAIELAGGCREGRFHSAEVVAG